MPRFYQYPACGTCRKAKQFLRARHVVVEERDIVLTPPSVDELRSYVERSGKPITRWFNTSGESYRAGGWKDRIAAADPDTLIAALAADGKLIKRPVLDLGDRVLVGFDEESWAAATAVR